MTTSECALERRLVDAVLADPVCATVLQRMPLLGLPDWWLTGGAVFQNVWNAVTGLPRGTGIKDYDVFYFDDADLSWGAEDAAIRAARALFEDVPATIELKNEARVHLWYHEAFGVPADPFTSAVDAINSFASTTCAVGVTRHGEDFVVHAPFGLEDVFAMHVRPHRWLASRDVYDAKVAQYTARWPELTSDPW